MAAGQQRLTTPELEPFIVSNVQPTGRELGAGAYGSVVEVKIPGASVAAKKLHDGLVQFGSAQQVRKWISDFVDECKLMSLLRHPHIVQFLGVCYLTGSRLPFLLMEKLSTSLDELLETHKEIPIDVKYSILIDVSRGLVYLHCRDPSIAHRDLTARNILLDSGLTAKIADLGVARIVNLGPGQIAATMTRAPGNIIYMPPEAVEEVGAARYNTAIDMFSFGNVALFTLTQVFMKNLKPATYRDPTTRKLVARSEIERREEYIQLLYQALGPRHPVVRLVLQCLEYDQEDRPSAVEVLQRLEEAGNTIPQNCRETKLELIRQIGGMQREKVEIQELRGQHERQLAEKENQIVEKQAQIGLLQADVVEKQEQVRGLEELTTLQQQQLETQCTEITSLRQENQARSAEVNELSGRLRSLELRQRDMEEPVAKPLPLTKKRPPQNPTSMTFQWRRYRDIPENMTLYGRPVVVNGKVYVRGASRGTETVCVYTPGQDVWDELPPPTVNNFTIVSLKDQLVLVGGTDTSTRKVSNMIHVWESCTRQWIQKYPPMKTALYFPSAIGYGDYLIVAGGCNSEHSRISSVTILDTTSNQWFTADSLPGIDYYYQSLLIEDSLYLLHSATKTVLRAHIPTLISRASPAIPSASQRVWESLPIAPFYSSSPVAIDNMLLTVGGSTISSWLDLDLTTSIQLYNTTTKQWANVGALPEAVYHCFCTELLGELIVLGGWNGPISFNRSVYIAKVEY